MSALRRVITLGAVVIGLPLACLGGVLFYGKTITENAAAEGTLLSPEESRARFEASRRAFQAMTPAQHLEAARVAAERSHNYIGAEHHLSAIPADAPEQSQTPAVRARIAQLKAEVAQRRRAVLDEAAARLSRTLRESGDPASMSDARREELRVEVAHVLDQLAPRGVGCVHVAGDDSTTLRFDNGQCDSQMLTTVVRPESLPPLRAIGFRRVWCSNLDGAIELTTP